MSVVEEGEEDGDEMTPAMPKEESSANQTTPQGRRISSLTEAAAEINTPSPNRTDKLIVSAPAKLPLPGRKSTVPKAST